MVTKDKKKKFETFGAANLRLKMLIIIIMANCVLIILSSCTFLCTFVFVKSDFTIFFVCTFLRIWEYWDIYFCKCGYMAYGLVQKTTYKKLSTWRRGLSCAKDCGNWFHILQFWYQQKKETINIVLPFFANIFFSTQCRKTSYT